MHSKELNWDEQQAWHYALFLLSRQEYSASGLRQKLSQKPIDQHLLEATLTKLAEKGWQSDERYAQLAARAQARKGFGKMRIKQYLKQKGIAESLINQSINQLEIDWFDHALTTYNKKFSGATGNKTVANDFKARQKRYQFLYTRGFSHDEIVAALQDEFE